MNWQLIDSVQEVIPGSNAAGIAYTNYPDSLFKHHFPSFPVTPGVLLTEIGAQLSGLLIQTTAYDQRGYFVFPVLVFIRDAKFRDFVPPNQELEVTTKLVDLRPESGICKATIRNKGRRCASMELVFAFEPDGTARFAEKDEVDKFLRSELLRVKSPWQPAT